MCFDFLYNFFFWNTSHSKNNWEGYVQNCTLVFMSRNSYSYQILIRLVFTGHVFEKYSNIKFHENSSSENRTDIMKLILAFRNWHKRERKYIPVPATKAYARVEVLFHSFLSSAQNGSNWSPSRPWCFTPGKKKATPPYRYTFKNG